MDRMSEILVLNGGRVAERGCHDQLTAGNGLYRQMLDAQGQLLALT
jgi:ABC-type multidrug transport system fused ATPase/permease subunit